MAARFPELTEGDLNCLSEQKKNSKNTKKAIKVALNVFRQYLSEERKVDEKELSASNVKLVAVLRKFYAEARKKNRELYTKALLVGMFPSPTVFLLSKDGYHQRPSLRRV